jgi:hypothetical protein
VFIGGGNIEVPAKYSKSILKLGFVPSQDKYDAYAAASALCVPSALESFSIVTMESWLAGRPVIVNAACPVTTTFCVQSNGGLYFANYEEFREILALLSTSPELCKQLGATGRRYVLANFLPEVIAERYRAALAKWGFDLAPILRLSLPVQVGLTESPTVLMNGFHKAEPDHVWTSKRATIHFWLSSNMQNIGQFRMEVTGFAHPGRPADVLFNGLKLGTLSNTSRSTAALSVPRDTVHAGDINEVSIETGNAGPVGADARELGFGFVNMVLTGGLGRRC